MKRAFPSAGAHGQILRNMVFTGLALCTMISKSYAQNISDINHLCLPINMPSQDTILDANKKVFAHYFNRFPISIDNKPFAQDYYNTQYLNPNGENNKWMPNGGFLRSRPLSVAPKGKSTFKIENLKTEVKFAIARGINGFTFNILSLKDIEKGNQLDNLLTAAQEVDPRFTIALMPDMSALKRDISAVESIVHTLYNQKGLYRSDDGHLVIAPFLSESVPTQQWKTLIERLNKAGKPITFIPTFLSAKTAYAKQYLPLSDGIGTFGTPLIGQGANQKNAIAIARQQNKSYIAGISPQGYRPKSYIYWESEGSLAYRNTWEDIIKTNANAIQLTTWNDFAESTQIIPYTDATGTSGTGYYNLTGYYASWFLTGQKPKIMRDALYYFHRKHSVSAAMPKLGKPLKPNPAHIPGKDIIDVTAFLTAPAKVEVTINNKAYTKTLETGLQSFTLPLSPGEPHFKLIRNNQTIIDFSSDAPIYGKNGIPSGYGDLTYWSGGATTKGVCMTNSFKSIE